VKWNKWKKGGKERNDARSFLHLFLFTSLLPSSYLAVTFWVPFALCFLSFVFRFSFFFVLCVRFVLSSLISFAHSLQPNKAQRERRKRNTIHYILQLKIFYLPIWPNRSSFVHPSLTPHFSRLTAASDLGRTKDY